MTCFNIQINSSLSLNPHYKVVAAVIEHNGKFLCMQKGKSKYPYLSNTFEFPGGKIEAGETPEAALVREVMEELNLAIVVGSSLEVIHHQYPDFSIDLLPFRCTAATNTITLNEHVSFQWLEASALPSLHWAAADVPIVQAVVHGY
ncbi:MAG: (deoxy)nucleoside triphosphate pyrophosphohydrolase [Chitinophagaceae bacterium]